MKDNLNYRNKISLIIDKNCNGKNFVINILTFKKKIVLFFIKLNWP